MSSGRRPSSRLRWARRADRLAERTEANVAAASTSVPPAVASAEIVAQSAMAPEPTVREPGREYRMPFITLQRASPYTSDDPMNEVPHGPLRDVRRRAAPG